jgi:hypothetical protein
MLNINLMFEIRKVRNEFVKDFFRLSPEFSFDVSIFKVLFLVHTYNTDITFHLTQIQDLVLSKDLGKVVSYLHIDVRAPSCKQ